MHKGRGGRYGGRTLTTAQATVAKTTDSRVLGSMLLTFGLGWLASSTGLVGLSMEAVVAAVLILLGVGMVATARVAASSIKLIVLGVALTFTLMTMSKVDIPTLQGRVGDHEFAPATSVEVEPLYRQLVGEMTIDLRETKLTGSFTDIDASLVAGRLTVHVPAGVAVEVTYKLRGGEVNIFDRRSEGSGLEQTVSDRPEVFTHTIRLHLSAVFGQIEVHRART